MEVGKLLKVSVIYIVVLHVLLNQNPKNKLLKWLSLQLGNWNLWHHLQVVTETNEKNLPSAT